MGFELWIEGPVAWARGTSEYRPMGAAVVAASDQFRRRDFHPRRRVAAGQGYAGIFASIGDLNRELRDRAAKGATVKYSNAK